LQDLGISIITGKAADVAKADYDLTILSPGIDPVVPLIQNFRRQGAALVGELELAFRFVSGRLSQLPGRTARRRLPS